MKRKPQTFLEKIQIQRLSLQLTIPILLQIITQERLRQARQSFNLALVTIIISLLFSIAGAGLLLSNQVTEGAVTTAGGLLFSVPSLQFAKDKSEELNKILTEINTKNHAKIDND